jgi:hypothetical protein
MGGFPASTVRSSRSLSQNPTKAATRSHILGAFGRTRNHPENPVLLSLQGTFPPAILALADGTVFIGNSIGATGSTVGEVVFNTAMTGYQEILTDPSYCQQIVTLTYPHIGNYGVNPQDIEADKVHAAGLIIKDLPLLASNFRATQTLSQYLVAEHTVAIANIDTRKLTRLLRTRGAQNGAIVGLAAGEVVTQALIDQAIAAAQGAPSMAGQDLAKVVSVAQPYEWTQTEWKLAATRWPTGLWHPGRTNLPCRRLRLRRQERTSCACWRNAAARSPWCRRRRRQRGAEIPARRHLPVQRPR